MEYQSFESAGDFLSACKPGLQDVLILDLNLPGMSGCDLLENFEKEGLQVPVVIVTAFDDPASRERCKRYGVKAFLRKPVDGEALIDIIRGV